MKEITAIIRRYKVPETKMVLDELGYLSLSLQSFDGRSRQTGDMCTEMGSEMRECICSVSILTATPSTYSLDHTLPKVALYVPKKLLTIVVPDDVVTKIVKEIIKVNKTGKHGDGKIFISPLEGATRIRTGEKDGEAIA